MDVPDLGRHVDDALAPPEGIAAVCLFGSVADCTNTPSSGVDIGILGIDVADALHEP